ncbi:carboxylesterase family protein, partial [Streptomyces sp. NPDC055886]
MTICAACLHTARVRSRSALIPATVGSRTMPRDRRTPRQPSVRRGMVWVTRNPRGLAGPGGCGHRYIGSSDAWIVEHKRRRRQCPGVPNADDSKSRRPARSGRATSRGRSTAGCGSAEDGVTVFRGIPYAAAPVGPLRFQAPVPAP